MQISNAPSNELPLNAKRRQPDQNIMAADPGTAPGGVDVGIQTDLLFSLDGETFAVPVTAVDEIIDPHRMTPVPNSDPLIPGIINVRGSIIPLFDLRVRLGMPQAEPAPTTRMIVFEQAFPDGELMRLCFSADAVESVVERPPGPLSSLPELGVSWPGECLAGSYRHNGELVICLEAASVFRIETMTAQKSDGRGGM